MCARQIKINLNFEVVFLKTIKPALNRFLHRAIKLTVIFWILAASMTLHHGQDIDNVGYAMHTDMALHHAHITAGQFYFDCALVIG